MTDAEHNHAELPRLRIEADRAAYASRRQRRDTDAAVRRLLQRLDVLGYDIDGAKRAIEAELRKEHFGRDPERPLAWRAQR
jgi:hypothetical protein